MGGKIGKKGGKGGGKKVVVVLAFNKFAVPLGVLDPGLQSLSPFGSVFFDLRSKI